MLRDGISSHCPFAPAYSFYSIAHLANNRKGTRQLQQIIRLKSSGARYISRPCTTFHLFYRMDCKRRYQLSWAHLKTARSLAVLFIEQATREIHVCFMPNNGQCSVRTKASLERHEMHHPVFAPQQTLLYRYQL